MRTHYLFKWNYYKNIYASFQDARADVILKYSADEARNLKSYGEFPETVKINETVTFGEEGIDDDIEFDEVDSSEEENDIGADGIDNIWAHHSLYLFCTHLFWLNSVIFQTSCVLTYFSHSFKNSPTHLVFHLVRKNKKNCRTNPEVCFQNPCQSEFTSDSFGSGTTPVHRMPFFNNGVPFPFPEQ